MRQATGPAPGCEPAAAPQAADPPAGLERAQHGVTGLAAARERRPGRSTHHDDRPRRLWAQAAADADAMRRPPADSLPKPPFPEPLLPRATSRRPTLRIFFSSFLCCHSSVRVVCGGPESFSRGLALCRGRQDLGAAGWGARPLDGAASPAAANAAVWRQDGGLGAPRRQDRRLRAAGRADAAAGGCRRPAAGLG